MITIRSPNGTLYTAPTIAEAIARAGLPPSTRVPYWAEGRSLNRSPSGRSNGRPIGPPLRSRLIQRSIGLPPELWDELDAEARQTAHSERRRCTTAEVIRRRLTTS